MARATRACLAAMLAVFSAACRADDGGAANEPAGVALPAASASVTEAAPAGNADQAPPAPAGEADKVQAAPAAGHSHSRPHAPVPRRTVAQGIEDSVRRLTRGLDLDAAQQAQLRQILMDQHRQVMALRNGANPAAQTDMAGTSLAIYDQTKARIRSILNDEQRKKYAADVPRNELAPAQADLQHWLDVQDAGRRQGKGEETQK